MKSVKRVACIVMVALLFCAVFAMSAMAAGASINVAKEVAIVGGETQVTVTVSIPAGVEITGASVRLKYDTDKLSVVSSAAGTLQMLTLNTDIAGTVNGNFFSAVSTNAGGVLYTVTFKVADGETVNSSDIAVSRYYFTSIDENDLEYNIPSADITLNVSFTCPHSWNSGEQTKAPSCFETGVTTYTCTLCGDTKTEPIATVDHTWDDGEVTTEPTCTENGVKTFTCSDCSETWTEAITALGHTPVTDAAVAPGCETDGLTEGSHCDVCKVVLVAQEVVGATGHSWGEWETVKEPTATEAGEKQRTCASCTEIETEQIEATGDTTIYLLGDVDGNGSVGVNDAVQILKYDAFMDVQSEYEASIWERLGDVNGQGGLNYLDAIDILQWDAFLEFDYPIGEPVEF